MDEIFNWIRSIGEYLLPVVVGLVIIACLIFIYSVFIVRRAQLSGLVKLKKKQLPDELGKLSIRDKLNLEESFKQGWAQFKRLFTTDKHRYSVPWFLSIGEVQSGKFELITQLSSYERQAGLIQANAFNHKGCNWRYFNNALVLDIGGSYVTAEKNTHEDKVWHKTLEEIQRHRPERPIDGVVLTLSIKDFIPDDSGSQGMEDKIIDKATLFYERLWKIQKQFGFVVPIYLLFTQCDLVEGFSSFWQPVDKKHNDEIFGWSNPYELDTVFQPTWVDQAYAYINNKLKEIQLEMASSARPINDLDGFFLFPQQLQKTRSYLKLFVETLLSPSDYDKANFLRGIYFSGTDKDSSVLQGQPGHLFVKQLFKQKIFAENQLGRPTYKAFTSRNKLIRRWQLGTAITFAVFLMGLMMDGVMLRGDIRTVQTTLKEIKSTIKRKESEILSEAAELHEASRLLESMENISTSHFDRTMLPTSWISSLENDLVGYITDGFEKVIFDVMNKRLQQKAADLNNQDYSKFEENESALVNGDVKARELLVLTDLIDRLRKFERHQSMYNQLAVAVAQDDFDDEQSKGDLQDFAKLVSYLFGFKLSDGFYENDELYRKALAFGHADEYASFEYRDEIMYSITSMAQQLNERLLNDDNLYQQFDNITSQLNQESSYSTILTSESAALEMVQSIKLAERLVNRPPLTSVAVLTQRFVPCYQVENMLSDFQKELKEKYNYDNVASLDQSIREFNVRNCDQPIRDQLFTYKIAELGPLLSESNDGSARLVFNPKVSDIANTLAIIPKETFLHDDAVVSSETDDPSRQINAPIPPGNNLSWNVKDLEKAVEFYREYDQFVNIRLLELPEHLRAESKQIAELKLRSNMAKVIAESKVLTKQSTRSLTNIDESQVIEQLKHFRQSQSVIDELLNIYQSFNYQDYQSLVKTTRQNALQVLDSIDRLSAKDALYLPRVDLNFWDGEQDILHYAFDINGKNQIEDYLKAQRERAFYLAKQYAMPIVQFLLNTPEVSNATVSVKPVLLNKWHQTLLAMKKFERKDTTSSVAGLESFLQNKVAGITMATGCDTEFVIADNGLGSDLFIQTELLLREEIQHTCELLMDEFIAQHYRLIAKRFNKNLAGRYPFVDFKNINQPLEDTDPTVLFGFLQSYGRVQQDLSRHLEKRARQDTRFMPAWDFIKRINEVKQFFAYSLLEDSSGAIARYDVDVSFQVMSNKEIGSEQIINWRFGSGSSQVEDSMETKQLAWQSGNPLRLDLRWAIDSALQPTRNIMSSRPAVSGNTASFIVDGNWALLKFIQLYRAPVVDFPGGIDANPHVLRFDVPVIRRLSDTDPLKVEYREQAQILQEQAKHYQQPASAYIRIGLLVKNPETKEDLSVLVPTRFPKCAPVETALFYDEYEIVDAGLGEVNCPSNIN